MEEHEQQLIKQEMRMGNMFFLMGSFASGFCLLLGFLVFNNAFWPILVAGILFIAGRLLQHNANREFNRDLAEDEKIVSIRTIDALEVNPVTGTYTGERITAADTSQHDHISAGYFVKIGNLRYPISEDTYNALQGETECELHRTPHSYTFLDCRPVSKR